MYCTQKHIVLFSCIRIRPLQQLSEHTIFPVLHTPKRVYGPGFILPGGFRVSRSTFTISRFLDFWAAGPSSGGFWEKQWTEWSLAFFSRFSEPEWGFAASFNTPRFKIKGMLWPSGQGMGLAIIWSLVWNLPLRIYGCARLAWPGMPFPTWNRWYNHTIMN